MTEGSSDFNSTNSLSVTLNGGKIWKVRIMLGFFFKQIYIGPQQLSLCTDQPAFLSRFYLPAAACGCSVHSLDSQEGLFWLCDALCCGSGPSALVPLRGPAPKDAAGGSAFHKFKILGVTKCFVLLTVERMWWFSCHMKVNCLIWASPKLDTHVMGLQNREVVQFSLQHFLIFDRKAEFIASDW